MATATASPPTIPPRPSRNEDKPSTPMIPPRPVNRRVQRPISPNPDRFAPSPLNETVFLKSPGSLQNGGRNGHNGDSIPRSTSVELPSLGEEGQEYAKLAAELDEENTAPEQTRTVADDLKLHAPRPSLPPSSAKQRVMTVTRTDSERAAAFGIGRPSSVEDSTAAVPSNRSLKKKASTASQLSTSDTHIDDEQGIPEIGLQVPMYKNAGDVQAPSPAITGAEGKHHTRRTSARGNLPPGSYGLHGHGVAPQDKLEKAYYDKHPDLLKKEKVQHHYDRPNDFSMSRGDLDKIVRDTASRGSGLAVKNYTGTPSDQVGWQAMEESASRIASPHIESPELKAESIHVDEPNRRRSVMFSDTESLNEDEPERTYTAPILADDEVAKDPSPYAGQPAVEPPVLELEETTSRPSSRPASVYKEPTFELQHTPLEDVEEYEPLFKDDEKKATEEPTTKVEKRKSNQPQRFPSADVWEDAPSSVFYTAEVSAPELFDEQEKPGPTPQEGETPAQAFARHQEELAEKELHGQRETQKSVWSPPPKPAASPKAVARPPMHPRFPSRDVWEDAPDSLQLETTVSTPQQDEVPASPADTLKPEIPERPSERPSIPERPKPKKQPSTDDKPAIPDRPKPQIPARPAKTSPALAAAAEPSEAAAAAAPAPRPKPAVPARPMGSKIAALQAGFMSDLNRRLQLGPQAPKKEEPAEEEQEAKPVEEKAPLADARKGRARGPARRAPAPAAAAAVPAVVVVEEEAKVKAPVVFGFVGAVRLFEIDPEEGDDVLAGGAKAEEAEPAEVEAKVEVKAEPEVEEKKEEVVEPEPEPAKEEVKAAVAAEPEPEPEPAAAVEPEPEAVVEAAEKAKPEVVS